jgi:hypothetical protein
MPVDDVARLEAEFAEALRPLADDLDRLEASVGRLEETLLGEGTEEPRLRLADAPPVIQALAAELEEAEHDG